MGSAIPNAERDGHQGFFSNAFDPRHPGPFGRGFGEGDDLEASKAPWGTRLSRAPLRGGDPVGQRFSFGREDGPGRHRGVAGNGKPMSLLEEPERFLRGSQEILSVCRIIVSVGERIS